MTQQVLLVYVKRLIFSVVIFWFMDDIKRFHHEAGDLTQTECNIHYCKIFMQHWLQ